MANTTNFSIEKPTVGGYRNTWGGTLNTGLDKLDELIALAMPVGSVTMYTKSTAPTATASGGTWLVCDGSAISRTTYSSLFTVIGTSFGSGDNNTTFNIPDLRARIPVGYNAGTIGSGATARTSKAVAASSGEEAHALTEGELAAHSHAIPATAHKHDITDKSHVHTGNASGNTGDASLTINDPEHDHQFNIHADWNSGNYGVGFTYGGGPSPTSTGTKATGITIDPHSHSLTTTSVPTGITETEDEVIGITSTAPDTGSNTPHNNMQPYLVLNYIILAKHPTFT